MPRAVCQWRCAIDSNNLLTLTEMGQIYEAESRPDRALYLYKRAWPSNPISPSWPTE